MATEFTDTDYEVVFTIDTIMAADPEEAARIVAAILADDGYAHRAVYEVRDRSLGDDAPFVTVDLA